MEEREVQSENAEGPMVLIVFGKVIASRETQFSKAS